jgi:hypothetical protein
MKQQQQYSLEQIGALFVRFGKIRGKLEFIYFKIRSDKILESNKKTKTF